MIQIEYRYRLEHTKNVQYIVSPPHPLASLPANNAQSTCSCHFLTRSTKKEVSISSNFGNFEVKLGKLYSTRQKAFSTTTSSTVENILITKQWT